MGAQVSRCVELNMQSLCCHTCSSSSHMSEDGKVGAESELVVEEAPQYVADFFEHTFGFDESKFSYSEVAQRFDTTFDGAILISKANGRSFSAGCSQVRH